MAGAGGAYAAANVVHDGSGYRRSLSSSGGMGRGPIDSPRRGQLPGSSGDPPIDPPPRRSSGGWLQRANSLEKNNQQDRDHSSERDAPRANSGLARPSSGLAPQPKSSFGGSGLSPEMQRTADRTAIPDERSPIQGITSGGVTDTGRSVTEVEARQNFLAQAQVFAGSGGNEGDEVEYEDQDEDYEPPPMSESERRRREIYWNGRIESLTARERIHAVFDAEGVAEEMYAERHSYISRPLFGMTFGMIILSVIVFTIESLPQFYGRNLNSFFAIETVCIAWFTIEIATRFCTCSQPTRFFCYPMNLIDLVAVLPYYLDLGFRVFGNGGNGGDQKGLVILRVVRLTRVFRVFKLSKYNEGVQVVAVSLRRSTDALSLLVFLMVLAMVLFGSMIFFAETMSFAATFHPKNETAGREAVWVRTPAYGGPPDDDPFQEGDWDDMKINSIPMGFWWCLVTLTTVGYGDTYPVTLPGFLVGVCAMMAGLLIVAFPIIIIGANFTEVRLEYNEEAKRKRRTGEASGLDPPPPPNEEYGFADGHDKSSRYDADQSRSKIEDNTAEELLARLAALDPAAADPPVHNPPLPPPPPHPPDAANADPTQPGDALSPNPAPALTPDSSPAPKPPDPEEKSNHDATPPPTDPSNNIPFAPDLDVDGDDPSPAGRPPLHGRPPPGAAATSMQSGCTAEAAEAMSLAQRLLTRVTALEDRIADIVRQTVQEELAQQNRAAQDMPPTPPR